MKHRLLNTLQLFQAKAKAHLLRHTLPLVNRSSLKFTQKYK